MRRSNQLNPMRMLLMLAVLWVAGTLLFAAESTPPAPEPRPAEATTVPAAAPAPQANSKGGRAADGGDASTEAETETEAEAAGDEDPPAEKAAAVPDESKAESGDGKQASSADNAGTPQRFVPSEKVRADFDVSFPIDI